MKKVLFILTLSFSILMFISCIDPDISNGRKLYKTYFNHVLKDPKSFIIYNEEYQKEGSKITWTLDYGAKNSMGGMIRKTETFTTIGNNSIFVNGKRYTKKDLK